MATKKKADEKKPAKAPAKKAPPKEKSGPKPKTAPTKKAAAKTPKKAAAKPAKKAAAKPKTAAKKAAKPAAKAPKAKTKATKPAPKTTTKPKAAPKKAPKAKAEPKAAKPVPKKAKASPKRAAKPAAAKAKAPAKKAPPPKRAAKPKAKPEPAVAKKPEKPRKAPPSKEAPPKEAPAKPAAAPSPRALFPLFDRWDLSGIEVQDAGLARHINLDPTYLPHTGGRWANRPFAKARMNLVERLTNSMMRTEKYTGKKGKTIQVVKRAFETVEKRTKKHPVQVLVDALENAAPREEITRLRFGGISVPRAVDVAPSRRLDLALRYLCRGAVAATFKNRKPIHQCLAEEMLLAADGDINSYAIGKKEEMERIAASAR